MYTHIRDVCDHIVHSALRNAVTVGSHHHNLTFIPEWGGKEWVRNFGSLKSLFSFSRRRRESGRMHAKCVCKRLIFSFFIQIQSGVDLLTLFRLIQGICGEYSAPLCGEA